MAKQTTDPIDPADVIPRGDRPYTIAITLLCLAIGVPVGAIAGALLLSLNQPLSTAANGQITWSFGVFTFPLALLVAGGVMAWSIFILPVMLARRAGRILDPQLWPIMGVLVLTALVVAAFFAAIALNKI